MGPPGCSQSACPRQESNLRNALSNLGLSLSPLNNNRYALAGGNPVDEVAVVAVCTLEVTGFRAGAKLVVVV